MVYNKNGYQVMVMDQIQYQIQIILILQHQNQYQKIQIIQLQYKYTHIYNYIYRIKTIIWWYKNTITIQNNTEGISVSDERYLSKAIHDVFSNKKLINKYNSQQLIKIIRNKVLNNSMDLECIETTNTCSMYISLKHKQESI